MSNISISNPNMKYLSNNNNNHSFIYIYIYIYKIKIKSINLYLHKWTKVDDMYHHIMWGSRGFVGNKVSTCLSNAHVTSSQP